VIVWGIDDKDLYEQARRVFLGQPSAGNVLAKRSRVLVQNLISQQKKRRTDIAVASLTSYNYSQARELLRKKHIAHTGIRCTPSGRRYADWLDRVLHPDAYMTEFEKTFAKIMGSA
jgi:hypothetical protein